MTLSVNSSYNSYTAPTNTATKVNGRQQTVMSANFADMLNANMATSTKPTTSTDKVTLSSQATQTTAQDDIEAEAQKRFSAMMEAKQSSNGWYAYKVPYGDDGYNFSTAPENIKLMQNLQSKYNEYSKNHDNRVGEVLDQINTLTAIQGRKIISTDELPKETAIHKRVLELMGEDMDKNGLNIGKAYQENFKEQNQSIMHTVLQSYSSFNSLSRIIAHTSSFETTAQQQLLFNSLKN